MDTLNLELKDFFYFFLVISALTVVSFVVVVMILNSLVEAYRELFSVVSASYAPKAPPKKQLVKKVTKKTTKTVRTSAKNSKAINATFEHQAIKTAEIEIPVIAADVLTYEGGELGSAYPERTNLYYSPEALKDKDFLNTVKRSPLQVQTHEKNTGEFNRGVDGWPLEAWWDETEKRVKVRGVVHGEENVEYTKENKDKPRFGTSAYITFLKVDREKGISPEGKPYDAIVRKAVNNHIAILPNVRDPKNVILAMNALDVTNENKEQGKENDEATNENQVEEKPMTQEEFNAMLKNANAKNEEMEQMKNSITNEVIERLKKGESDNAKNEGDKKEEPVKETAENPDDKDKDDDASASNALPSEEMVKDFSEALGITFKKTPSLKELGAFAGIEAKNSIELVSALNAKRKELKGSVSYDNGSASNSATVKSVSDALKEF